MKVTSVVRAAILSLVAAVSFATSSARAASDYFLKIEGIPGEAVDRDHPGEIEISSWSHGMVRAGADSSAELTLSKRIDKSSPLLIKNCAQGTHFKSVTLTCRKSSLSSTGGQEDFLVVTLNDVLISSFSNGGSAGENVPTDSFSLNFTKIEFDYIVTDKQGEKTHLISTYDLKSLKK